MSLGVKLELWPYGQEHNAEPLGSIKLSNVGDDYFTGNYSFTFRGEDWNHAQQQAIEPLFGLPSGVVRNHDRVQGGGWRLLYEALKQVFEPGE